MPIIVPGDGSTPSPTDPVFPASDLVEEVRGELSGHTQHVDQTTYLTEALGLSGLSFKVADLTGFSRGLVEIDHELISVEGVSDSENTLNVFPNGRGYRTSKAATHALNAEVTMSPRFPRYLILDRINDVIQGVYPDLFAVGEVEVSPERDDFSYELPADCDEVLSVHQQVTDRDTWVPLKRWRFNTSADSGDFPTGNSLDLFTLYTEDPVLVKYRKSPVRVEVGGDFSDSGLNRSAWPAILYGALHRLSSTLTLGHLDASTASSQEYQRQRAVSAVEVSERYYALHQQFLAEERRRLQDLHPTQPHSEH